MSDEHADLERRVDSVEARVSRNEQSIERLAKDMTEIRASLLLTATKDDIAQVKEHMTNLVMGVLKQALNNVPARTLVAWTAAVAIGTAALVTATLHVLR